MDIDELARSAVEAVATHLAERGTDAAGQLMDDAINHLYQLMVGRLQRTSTGGEMLSWLQLDPADVHRRAGVAQLVTSEARNDTQFAESLGQAAHRAGIIVQGPGSWSQSGDNTIGIGSISTKTEGKTKVNIRIGNRHYQVGTGGLAIAVIGLVLLIGGGTTAAVLVTTNSAVLSSAVGRWERPGYQAGFGVEVSPMVLTISPDGRFAFSVDTKINVPEAPPADFPGPGVQADCHGTVEPTGDHFTLHITAGLCKNVEAKLTSDGSAIDIYSPGESTADSIRLTKTGT